MSVPTPEPHPYQPHNRAMHKNSDIDSNPAVSRALDQYDSDDIHPVARDAWQVYSLLTRDSTVEPELINNPDPENTVTSPTTNLSSPSDQSTSTPHYGIYFGALSEVVTSLKYAKSRTTPIMKLLEATDPPAIINVQRGARFAKSTYRILLEPPLTLRQLNKTLSENPPLKTSIEQGHNKLTQGNIWRMFNSITSYMQNIVDGINRLISLTASNNTNLNTKIDNLATSLDKQLTNIQREIDHIALNQEFAQTPNRTQDDNPLAIDISTNFTNDELMEMGEDPSDLEKISSYNKEYLDYLGIKEEYRNRHQNGD